MGTQLGKRYLISFFNTNNKPDDTLLFYYSGHGVPDRDGDTYLASSDIDPDPPFREGFSFEQLTRAWQGSISTRIVAVLDCCYSGAAKISKGQEEDAVTLGAKAIDNKLRKFEQGQGEGNCIGLALPRLPRRHIHCQRKTTAYTHTICLRG